VYVCACSHLQVNVCHFFCLAGSQRAFMGNIAYFSTYAMFSADLLACRCTVCHRRPYNRRWEYVHIPPSPNPLTIPKVFVDWFGNPASKATLFPSPVVASVSLFQKMYSVLIAVKKVRIFKVSARLHNRQFYSATIVATAFMALGDV